MRNRILLIEDNEKINRANKEILEMHGYEVVVARCISEAIDCMAVYIPDLIILDLMLPDGSGLDFCTKLYSLCPAPILILTALGEKEDVVRGLLAGGDDYMAKPYHIDEFLARIYALLRRKHIRCEKKNTFMQEESEERVPKYPQILKYGPLTLDLIAQQAFLEEDNLQLTPKEFSLLLLFVSSEKEVLSIHEIYQSIWKQAYINDESALKMLISRLRRKLGKSGIEIQSVRGEGYSLNK